MAFALERMAQKARLGLVDVAIAQVAVDAHLLAWQGIEAEPCGNLGHALRPLGDNHELGDRDDEEDDQSDREISSDHEAAEGVDDVAGVRLQQDKPRGGNGDGEAKQRCDENDRRQGRKLDRPNDIDGREQNEHARRDVGCDQHVDQGRRQRKDHYQDRDQHQDPDDEVAAAGDQGEEACQPVKHRHARRGRWT